MSDQTPTYIATCPDCGGLICCAVADLDAPTELAQVLTHVAEWKTHGLILRTGVVRDIHTWPDPLGHRDGCVRAKKQKRLAL